MTSVILGALCILLRWLQTMNVIEEETGLPMQGAALSWILAVVVAVAVAIIWFLSRQLLRDYASTEPELALADPPQALNGALVLVGFVTLVGSAVLFFSGGNIFVRIAALLGILSAPALMFYTSLPHWGGLGAFLSLLPVFFFCYWLVVIYREFARDPVLWSYALLVLSVSALLLAAYRLCGYLFYRAKPVKAVFACCAAPIFSLSILTDSINIGIRLIVGGWAVGLLLIVWLLIVNMQSPEQHEYEDV